MIRIRRDSEIYAIDGGWFKARWHFSFDQYRDPENMGWGLLRVFNDDRLVPGAVWPLHPHRDIEGITYVVEGTFRHEDSLGNDGVLLAGSVQRMTLGRGAYHSEQNGSQDEPMRFIQMWIMPTQRGLEPSVEQKVFTPEQRTNRLLEVLAPEGGNAVLVHQDARVFVSRLEPGATVSREMDPEKAAYLYTISGGLELNGEKLSTGDAAKIRDEPRLDLGGLDTSELILVEVPFE
jgi:quercetin 2,3-dioxygenase